MKNLCKKCIYGHAVTIAANSSDPEEESWQKKTETRIINTCTVIEARHNIAGAVLEYHGSVIECSSYEASSGAIDL